MLWEESSELSEFGLFNVSVVVDEFFNDLQKPKEVARVLTLEDRVEKRGSVLYDWKVIVAFPYDNSLNSLQYWICDLT